MAKKKLRKPSLTEQKKLMDLRCRSKRGEFMSAENLEYVHKMWKKYPEWYHSTGKDVFEATKPFGSTGTLEK